MLLPKEQAEQMRLAVEEDTRESLETHQGEHTVADKDGKEYTYKWRNGHSEIYVEGDSEEDGPEVCYEFAVRVELVAVSH